MIAVGKARPRPLVVRTVDSVIASLVLGAPGAVNAKIIIGEYLLQNALLVTAIPRDRLACSAIETPANVSVNRV